jgi:hypothetical protein
MSADAVSLPDLVAGILADEGSLTPGLTLSDAISRLEPMWSGTSTWEAAPVVGNAPDLDARLSLEPDWSAGWIRPDPAVVGQLGATLEQAWRGANEYSRTYGIGSPTFRLRVRNLEDYQALRQQSFGGWQVMPHIALATENFTWRWPLRVAVLGSNVNERVLGDNLAGSLFQRIDTAGAESFEVAIVRGAEIALLDDSAATVAIVVDADPLDPAMRRLVDQAPEIGLAGVLLVPGQPDRLIEGLAVNLSHDQPLDVAVCEEAPDAILAASDWFLPYTSVRAWAANLGERLGAIGATAEVGQRLRRAVREVPFDTRLRVAAT